MSLFKKSVPVSADELRKRAYECKSEEKLIELIGSLEIRSNDSVAIDILLNRAKILQAQRLEVLQSAQEWAYTALENKQRELLYMKDFRKL